MKNPTPELALFLRFIGKAIRYRDEAKEAGISQSIRQLRLAMMKTYGRLAVAGGIRGSWRKHLTGESTP